MCPSKLGESNCNGFTQTDDSLLSPELFFSCESDRVSFAGFLRGVFGCCCCCTVVGLAFSIFSCKPVKRKPFRKPARPKSKIPSTTPAASS